jgi:hypothetical protein
MDWSSSVAMLESYPLPSGPNSARSATGEKCLSFGSTGNGWPVSIEEESTHG